jgi:hypothetical protein
MKKAIILLLLFLSCLDVSAWTLDHYARNAYSFEPLPNVHIVLLNNDTNESMDSFSDTTGHTAFTVTTEGNYTLTSYYPLYALNSISFYINDSTTRISYLTYDSVSLTKVSFSDMTFLKHTWCFYYEDNNRLFGCFNENDTIHFPITHNYTVYPKLAMWEQIGFLNIRPFLSQISIFLIVIIILAVILTVLIAFGVILIWRLLKK